MVDKTKQASLIEVYRADFATPENFESMRFWIKGELDRIQSGFFSTDEKLKELVDQIGDSSGQECVECPQGDTGPKGDAGEGITVYQQTTEPASASPGDVWFVTEYL